MFDLIIKNGTIYDGTLSEPVIADIGIIGDKISAIEMLPVKAKKIIDVKNLIVTPGFIDIHTHCDMAFKRTILKKYHDAVPEECKRNHNQLHQGITTVVTGNCGLGYSNTEFWLDIVDSIDFSANVFHLIPYGIVREDVFGDNQPKKLSSSQLELLKNKVTEEMENGAIGFSTGLEYAPGCFSSTEELIKIAKVVRKYNGIYATHMRNETGIGKGNFNVLDSIKEAIEIGKQAEIPVEISHLKLGLPKDDITISQVLELIEKARDEGLNITVDQYPYNAGNTMLTHLLPDKFKTSDSIKKEFKSKAGSRKLKSFINLLFETYINPSKIMISDYPQKREYEGLTLEKIAQMENKNISDCYVDMVCEEISPWGIFFLTDEEDIKQIALKDYVITSSDSWTVQRDIANPHPRFYGSFPKKIRKYVLEDKILNLEQAIRSMTSLPAEKFGIKNRGKIKEGYFADINLINLEKITDKATYKNPHQYAEGLEYIFINGNIDFENKNIST